MRRARAVVLALVLACASGQAIVAGAQAQRPPALTVAEYVAQLGVLSTRIAGTDAAHARALAGSLPPSLRVDLDGTIHEFTLSWLTAPLLDPPSAEQQWRVLRGDLVRRVNAAASEAARVTPGSGSDAEAAGRVLRAVLSQRAYSHVREESWQADLRRRFEQWLADVWGRTVGARLAPRTLAWALAWGAAIGAMAALLFWLIPLAVRRRSEQPIALGMPSPPRLPGHVLAGQAVALLRAGQSREGARLAYRAAVHRLEEEGALPIDDARTPREYLQLLPAQHRRHAALARLTAAFERIWYGSHAATAEERGEILVLLQHLECLPRDPAI